MKRGKIRGRDFYASGCAMQGIENAKPVANPVAVLREDFDDCAVVFNPDTGGAVGMNRVGVAVWKLMDGNRSIDDLAAQIECGFMEVPTNVKQEIAAFVAQLAARGFVGYEVPASVP